MLLRLTLSLVVMIVTSAAPALARDGRVTRVSTAPFARVAEALEQSIADHQMALVCHANAQKGAAARGVAIRGNQVLMVFRNDFAVRLLRADPAAGFEAPIRIYVHETPDGTATVSYIPPSVLFARYGHPEVQAVARELEPIVRAIVDAALARAG
jgi:uncharacterized protein (DUF302 family)